MTLTSGYSGNGEDVSAAPPSCDGLRAPRPSLHLGEIRGGDEAVVTSADDDRVVPIRSHQRSLLVLGRTLSVATLRSSWILRSEEPLTCCGRYPP